MSESRALSSRWRPILAGGLAIGLAGGVAATELSTAATAAPRAAVSRTSHVAKLPSAKKELVGTFRIAAGKVKHGKVTGSYLRMLTPSGAPFLNGDSSAKGGSYTLIKPGTDKGLETGRYQPEPSPAFDSKGNSLADRIYRPVKFEGTEFSGSTAKIDPSTGKHVPAPSITVSGHKLSGNLEAFAAAWNRQQFNQGSPKPGGKYTGVTSKVTGTYNPATHRYTLTWRSQIVGGPFNNFSGVWHFTGVFHAA